MQVLWLVRRSLLSGSCPSECPSRAGCSPVHRSESISDLGGAKRARTADLLHAMPADFVRHGTRTSGTRTSGHMQCLAGSGADRKGLGA
jgi:hypothetical protein